MGASYWEVSPASAVTEEFSLIGWELQAPKRMPCPLPSKACQLAFTSPGISNHLKGD